MEEIDSMISFYILKFGSLILFFNPLSQLGLLYSYFWITNLIFFDSNVSTKMGDNSHWITLVILIWWIVSGVWSYLKILNTKYRE